MRSHSFQGSFKAAEVDPTPTRPSLATLQPTVQAVTGLCWVDLPGRAGMFFGEMEKEMGWMIWKRGGFLCKGEWLQVQRCL